MNHALHYKDIILNRPKYSKIRSRDDIEASVEFLGKKFKSVAIPANMTTAINFEQAEVLDLEGYFYILHRFYEYSEIFKWVQAHGDMNTVSISVGVKDRDIGLIDNIANAKLRVDYITIDIAFGHSILMKEMITHIKTKLPHTKIIAGNVCTEDACTDLASFGADAIKIGLSCGKSCSTYNATGVGSPMFSAVLDCHSPVPVIADGGIREVGDICKAMVAGATMVMIGSEFVKCTDSPAEWNYVRDTPTGEKIFFGSASATNKGEDKYVEGSELVLLRTNGLTYLEYLDKINQGIRSCMSYHNLRDVSKLHSVSYDYHTSN